MQEREKRAHTRAAEGNDGTGHARGINKTERETVARGDECGNLRCRCGTVQSQRAPFTDTHREGEEREGERRKRREGDEGEKRRER